jgi:hypothetical protein
VLDLVKTPNEVILDVRGIDEARSPRRMQEVERGLAALPAEVVERASSPEAFGSWFLAFRAAPLPCRLRWEGPGLHP